MNDYIFRTIAHDTSLLQLVESFKCQLWQFRENAKRRVLFHVFRSPCLTCRSASTAIDIRCIQSLLIRTWIETMAISHVSRARKPVQNLFILANVAAVRCSCSGNFSLENALWSGAAHISRHRRLGARNKWRAKVHCMRTRIAPNYRDYARSAVNACKQIGRRDSFPESSRRFPMTVRDTCTRVTSTLFLPSKRVRGKLNCLEITSKKKEAGRYRSDNANLYAGVPQFVSPVPFRRVYYFCYARVSIGIKWNIRAKYISPWNTGERKASGIKMFDS